MATKQLRRSLAMLLFVTACQSTPATQVTVRVVPEDQALADDISRLRYQAAGPELSFVPVRYPFDIATVPANDLPADFRLEVTAELRDRSSITAVVTGAFVENEHREVVMVLSRRCAVVTCGVGQSCVDGSCERERVTTDPYREVVTPIFPRDTGVTDAGSDTSADTGADTSTDTSTDTSADTARTRAPT